MLTFETAGRSGAINDVLLQNNLKVFTRVGVRAVCRPFKFFHTKFKETCFFYGAAIVYRAQSC